MWAAALVPLAVTCTLGPAQETPWREAILLHAPMDGTADAVQSRGDGHAKLTGPTAFLPGRRGQALSLAEGAGCSYAVEGNFERESGSFCAWVSLNRDTAIWDMQKGSWYQWLLGVRDWTADPAKRSDLRVFFDRTLTLQFATPQPAPTNGSAVVPTLGWTTGTWHHVGMTWRAHEIQLFVDGEPHERPLTSCDILAAATGRLLLGCSDESGHGALDGLVDEVYILSRPLAPAEMKTVYLATGALAEQSDQPVLPEPLLSAPLDGATAARLAGGGTMDAEGLGLQFVSWQHGRALSVQRRAYDLKASCAYKGLPGPPPPQGTCMFWVRSDGPKPWDGTERGVRRPLVSIHSSSFSLEIIRSPEQQLAVVLKQPVEAQVATDIARWVSQDGHHVACSWDLVGRSLSLYVDGRQVGTAPIPGEAKPGADAAFELWVGADDADRYTGDCADAAFRDLRLFGTALPAEQIAAVASGREGRPLHPMGLAGQPVTTTAPEWSAAFVSTGLAEGIDEYLAQGGAGGPQWAASATKHFLVEGPPTPARTIALWFRLPARPIVATKARVLSVRFREPTEAVANFEDDALSQRLTAAATDGAQLFGGSPSTYRLCADAWHQIVLVCEGKRTQLYLDGVLQEQTDATLLMRGIAEVALAGETGDLAEAIGWSRALSGEQVLDLLNYGAEALAATEPIKEAEKPYWDIGTAYRDKEGGIDRICLDALWRFLPADGIEAVPPLGKAWGYSRLPGAFSAVHLWKLYDQDMKLIPTESWTDGRWLTRYGEPRYDAGWYERLVDVPAEWKGRRIGLVFDHLASYVARIHVNGKLVAHFEQTKPGEALLYPPRRADVSQYAGQTIRVSLEIGWDNAGAGDFLGVGDTWLTAEDGWVDIENVTPTTKLQPERTVEVRAVLRNSGSQAVDVSVGASIADQRREAVALPAQAVHLDAGEAQEIRWQKAWPEAHLWCPDDPYLYTLAVQVKTPAGALLKESRRRMGFREFGIKGRDFVLNGKPVHLRGTNTNLPYAYLFTDPTYLRGMYQARKDLGYNLIQYWADSSVSSMGGQSWALDRMLDWCDEMGFVVAAGNVSHLQEVQDEAAYRQTVDAFTRKYGAHASVCLWFVNPNTCWYNYGMHPGNLDYVYAPQEGEPGFANQGLAKVAEEVVSASDPQGRPVFTYASGNFGPLYSAMQYFALGLPLQEEADWPSLWAEAAPKPLIPVETDLKWTPHWVDFEAYERSWQDKSPTPVYYVEHAARYLGDAPYLQTDHPGVDKLGSERPEGTLWNNLAAEPYVLEVRALAAKDILRGWRGYGMSGMTFHAEEDDLFETWSRLGETFPPYTPAELQTPGPKAELKYQWFPRYYYADRPNQPYNETFKRNFRPLLAFIGSATLEPDRKLGEFTSKDHAYYAGETIRKEVVIVNDRTDRDLRGRYEWRVVDPAGKVVASGDGDANLKSGEIAHLSFSFAAPAVDARTDLRIELTLSEANQAVADDALNLQVYPKPQQPPAAEPVALVDTADGRTGKALEAIGIPFVGATSAAQLADRRCVIVGEGAMAEAASMLADFERSGRLEQGVNVLVLAQAPCALLNLIHEPTYERYVWPRDVSHPVMAGLQANDFANWRGASAMCAAYPAPDPKTKSSPHYPGLKWHWGNRGIVSTYPMRKPAYGNFRVLVDDGFDLVLSPLMEWLVGPSRVVLCQLDLTERAGTDPVATEVLRRLCTYVAAAPPPTWYDATYTGSDAGRAYLAPHAIRDQARIAEDGVIVTDGAVEPGQADSLLAHADRGGTLFLVNPTVEALQAVGLSAEEQPVWHALPPREDWPLLAGVSPSDLYWRQERTVPVLTGLPAGSHATTPAVVAEVPHGKGRLVVWTVNAAQYDDLLTSYENNRWNTHRAYYAKTSNHDKIHRALSLILTNLGVPMRSPQGSIFGGEYGQNNRVANPMFRLELPQWRFQIDPDDVGKAQGWQKPEADDLTWRTLRAPGMWQDQGVTDANPKWQYDDPTMKHPYNGVAWYRVRVTIPEVLRGRELYFDADSLDDYDEVYFNGELIGQTGKETPNWWMVPRHYRLPANAIRFGAENTLAARVTDTAGSGGFGGKQPPRIQAPASPDAFTPYLAGLSDYDINAFHNW